MKSIVLTAAMLAAFAHPSAHAQTNLQPELAAAAAPVTNCPAGIKRPTTITGIVADSTQALIPGATLSLDKSTTTSGADGHFRFTCVPAGSHHLTANADGFAPLDLPINTPHTAQLTVTLQLATVQSSIQVNADGDNDVDANDSGPSPKISGSRLQTLADDPDDLLSELQNLGGAASGNPANTTITVDGFQGASSLPPKSSIAYIKVNPDPFSAEYSGVNIQGGRVEVYTKPGQKVFHGAVFTTNGSSWENARDPFSLSKAAIGKQRYGFELSGPVRKKGSDFALTFEHRIINDFAVVNAITFDSSANQTTTIANVPTPQSLWLGTARVDWQLGPKNTFIASYSANVNSLNNQGVGGTTLATAGYNSQTYEHMYRVSDVTTATANFMHESHLSLRFDGSTDQPESAAPSLSVAGAFTGGGASAGPQQIHELNIEFDDDAILTIKKHTLKVGIQLLDFREHQFLTTGFNGAITYGGGIAPALDANNNIIPGQTETITGVQQYQRALLGLPGGVPSETTTVSGTPIVDFFQSRDSAFAQDDWNFGHGLHFVGGVRFDAQNDPTSVSLSAVTPRIGVLWSPGKKNLWTLHAHLGLFTQQSNTNTYATILSQNGVMQTTTNTYPLNASTSVGAIREFAPHMVDPNREIDNIGGTHSFPRGWNLSADFYTGHEWNVMRTRNINSPLNDSPNGPRPGPANLNILQTQNSGKGGGNVTFIGLNQGKNKYITFFLGGVYADLMFNSDFSPFSTPQSSLTDAGERAHQTGNTIWNFFGNATLNLPKKLQLSTNFNGGAENHYNVTTGFDNNGDGDFNDRPQYALPGTPLCSASPTASPCAYSTPYGLLVNSGGTGATISRNVGRMPANLDVDANLQRAFVLTRNKKADHQQTITLNVRSSNVINHLNVSAIGGVLGSPLFGVPYAANNGRRVEIGARYSF